MLSPWSSCRYGYVSNTTPLQSVMINQVASITSMRASLLSQPIHETGTSCIVRGGCRGDLAIYSGSQKLSRVQNRSDTSIQEKRLTDKDRQDWTGGAKTLNRKKEHLLKCPVYLEYALFNPDRRCANVASSDVITDGVLQAMGKNSSPRTRTTNEHEVALVFSTKVMAKMCMQHSSHLSVRNATGIQIYRSEFFDDTEGRKCMRTRCNFCGYVRAKNTTRQFEHLQNCGEFLESAEGQQAQANGELDLVVVRVSEDDNGQSSALNSVNSEIWKGGLPNPNLAGRPIAKVTKSLNKNGRPSGPIPLKVLQTPKLPSMINLLLSRSSTAVAAATQQQFLSNAGCGTLSAVALCQWLAQEIHISRALIPFVGSLIGKIRIPESDKLQCDPIFRATDLLCSAVNNMKKELEFIEATKRKYFLQVPKEEPNPATKGIIDLLHSASTAPVSLLEGLVVLCFIAARDNSSHYTLPSYLTPSRPSGYGSSDGLRPLDNAHIVALHESFIQNWTSINYIRFVEACKDIVDEIANAQTSGNGAQEMMACERAFKQAIWLWDQIWPEMTGTEEEAEPAETRGKSLPEVSKAASSTKSAPSIDADGPIEIGDDDDVGGNVNLSFEEARLSAIEASNRAQ
nr:hypothetical protein CFP56_03819 [Quercus suber]